MAVVRLDHLDDRRLDDYRKLTDRELLRHRKLFVAEGRMLVERLLDSRHRIVSLLLNGASFASLEPRLSRRPELPVYVCETEELASIVGFNLHRGCLALAERPPDQPAIEMMKSAEVLLVLEAITDPDNMGSAFRNAAAFGVGAILLSPACCDPLYRKAVRTSMGAVLRMPYARLEQWPRDLTALKAEGFTLIALTPGEQAIDLSTCARRQPRQRMAILVGSEGPGLSSAAASMADACVRIPMSPGVDSLNLATATGIALYYLTV